MIFSFIKKYYKELILLFTIFLDIIGFFGIITPELEILDKIIAWLVFAYFFYQISISKLFFGVRHRLVDVMLIFAYFNLVIKNFMAFLSEIISSLSSEKIIGLVSWVLNKDVSIEILTFYIGAVLIIIVSYITARFVKYTRESIYYRIIGDRSHLDDGYIGVKEKTPSITSKTFYSFILYNAFFLVIFNLLVEWLGFIEDDMITVFSIVIVIILFRRYNEQIKNLKIINIITNIADDFYGNIISNIKRRRYIILLCTGLLSLQILTDFFVFILPMFIGQNEVSYFGKLAEHVSLVTSFINDFNASSGFLIKIGIMTLYVLDAIFIIFLMLMPTYLWYLTYTEKKEHIPKKLITLFFISLSSFIVLPIFKFQSLDTIGSQYNILGVDIILQGLTFRTSTFYVIIISLLIGFFVFVLLKISKKFVLFMFALANYSFIVAYTFFFVKGTLLYYLNEINVLTELHHYLIVFYFTVFMMITFAFYLTAIIGFASEINSEFEFININRKINYRD